MRERRRGSRAQACFRASWGDGAQDSLHPVATDAHGRPGGVPPPNQGRGTLRLGRDARRREQDDAHSIRPAAQQPARPPPSVVDVGAAHPARLEQKRERRLLRLAQSTHRLPTSGRPRVLGTSVVPSMPAAQASGPCLTCGQANPEEPCGSDAPPAWSAGSPRGTMVLLRRTLGEGQFETMIGTLPATFGPPPTPSPVEPLCGGPVLTRSDRARTGLPSMWHLSHQLAASSKRLHVKNPDRGAVKR